MPCDPIELKHVPLFALLDDEELAVLASQVDLKTFAPRQRIYKIGDPGMHAYIMVSGNVQVTTVDEDHQEVVVDQPGHGEFFGFASMLDQTPHQTNAVAMEKTTCVEISRDDIAILLQRKPMAGMDMLTVLGHQFHASQQLVRIRASRNANEVIEEKYTFGERVADMVASFGGSWTFIIVFGVVLVVVDCRQRFAARESVGSLPVHPAQSLLVHAGGYPGAGHHDEPESPGQEGPSPQRVGFRREPACRSRNSEPLPQA